MNIKHIFATAALTLAATLVSAQSLFVQKADGTVHEYALDNVTQVSFGASTGKQDIRTIAYFSNDGTEASQVVESHVAKIAIIGQGVTIERDDYLLTSWNTKADGTGEAFYVGEVCVSPEPLTLYAQWLERYYTVAFHANNGAESVHEEKWDYTASHPGWDPDFTYEGYVFNGWNTKADGSGTDYSAEDVVNISGPMTLYAQWKTKFYAVTFHANNGTADVHEEQWDYTIANPCPALAFTYDGHVLLGWNTKADGSGTYYEAQDSVIITEPTSFYAQWALGGIENGHVYVDLGLPSGTKWATMNVGANKPAACGSYFAWGETEPKTDYSWATYKYGNAEDSITKYCTYSPSGKDGFTDGKRVLEKVDDAASVNWGGNWRMPTYDEFNELIDEKNCILQLAMRSGICGYIVTSKSNGAFIFLPAADGYFDGTSAPIPGYLGNYWTSELSSWSSVESSISSDTCFDVCNTPFLTFHHRFIGFPVRPVLSVD